MKYLYLFLPLILIIQLSCSGKPCPHQQQIEKLESELAQYKVAKNEPSGELTHMVYFDLKDDLTKIRRDSFSLIVNQLSGIELVNSFRAGAYEELGDVRALNQYEYAMILLFKNKSDYNLYQNDPIHKAVKDATADFLASPPVTYDFQ